MRNKYVIENLVALSLNKAQYLKVDIENGKPHVTGQYAAEQLAMIESKLNDVMNYLQLED
jgi:hypothetical protein